MACETAHFRPADAGCFVIASLACPMCLSSAVEWSLAGGGYDRRARCVCMRCEHERDVYLTPMQALRLALHSTCPLDPTLPPHDPLTLL
jgi:hypothetical protein